jgi:Lon protease-like protein
LSATLALFPLELVVFPNEPLNLHIFEERYKKLINYCIRDRKNFGIPSVINGRLSGYGTEIKLLKVVKTYESGEMDIKTKGLRPFRLLSFREEDGDKLYAEGEVEYMEYFMNEDKSVRLKLIDLLQSFYQLSGSEQWIDLEEPFSSFDIAHKIGLHIEEELELFKLKIERDRQIYLIEHLKKMIPTLQRVQDMNEKIRQNGHFRKLPNA